MLSHSGLLSCCFLKQSERQIVLLDYLGLILPAVVKSRTVGTSRCLMPRLWRAIPQRERDFAPYAAI
jgi:hypothetical protein